MLIREHYARNEIKWQHEVICLSLNWVFLAGGFFPPNFLGFAFRLELNARFHWACGVLCPSVWCFSFGTYRKKWQLKCFIFLWLRTKDAFMLYLFSYRLHEKTMNALSENCLWFRWVLQLLLCAGFVLSCWLLPCLALMLRREAYSSSSGSGKNNKGERLPPYGISDQEKRGSVAGLLFDVRFNQ